MPSGDSPSDRQQPPHLRVCTLDNRSTVWTQLPFGSKGRAREGKKLRTHTAFFKLYCLQNTLSVAFSVARHYHKPFIANHLSWRTIRVINILNGVNLFWRRIVVTTCMISSEILFKLAPKGLQTIIKVHQDMEGIFSKYVDKWFVWSLKYASKSQGLAVYPFCLITVAAVVNLHQNRFASQH